MRPRTPAQRPGDWVRLTPMALAGLQPPTLAEQLEGAVGRLERLCTAKGVRAPGWIVYFGGRGVCAGPFKPTELTLV